MCRELDVGKGGDNMLTLILMFFVFSFLCRIAWILFRATWGITKFILGVIFFPLFIILAIAGGLVYLIFPALVIIGIVALIGKLTTA